MKYLSAILLLVLLVQTGCTLRPRNERGRPLSPDHEAAAPDHWPQDSLPADSVAPAKP